MLAKLSLLVIFSECCVSVQNLDISDTGDFILGYQVSFKPVSKQHQDGRIQNVTELTAPLVMEDGNYSVIVRAFNMAGYGPATNLSIDTQRHNGKYTTSYYM